MIISLKFRDFCGRCGAAVRFLERCAVGDFLECTACGRVHVQAAQALRGLANGMPCIAASGEVG